MNTFRLFTLAIALLTACDVLESAWMESSLGKKPFMDVEPHRMVPPSWDSSLGKPPTQIAFDGPPPRGEGVGLRFNTAELFYVYTDYHASPNHFAPSGWMGDYDDIVLEDASTDFPADGPTCIKITYLARGSNKADWAGIYWQEPINNWGNKTGGFSLTGMRRLTFWARGARGGEKIAVFKVAGIQGEHPDSGSTQIGPLYLTPEWQQYAIDLTGTDLSRVSGGFAWATGRFDNAGPITFYLDEIRFERHPLPPVSDGLVRRTR